MSFKNVIEHNKAFSDEELEGEKNNLLSEIRMLGIKQNEAREVHINILKDIDEKRTELAVIEEQIDNHKPTLEKHLGELSVVHDKIAHAKEVLGDNERLDAENVKKREEVENHLVSVSELEDKVKNLKAEIAILEYKIIKAASQHSEFSELSAHTIVEHENRVKEFDKHIIELQSQTTILEHDIESLSNLDKDWVKKINEKREELDGVEKQTADKYTQLHAIEKNIQDSAEKAEKYIKDKTIDIDNREAEIVNREGDVSLKERWLEEKRQKLANIKVEVESHLGRKIPVNIPNE